MDIDYLYFVTQRSRNTAWNLLCANRAPLIFAFMHEAFIKPGRTSAPESELIEVLKDLIFKINSAAQAAQTAQTAQAAHAAQSAGGVAQSAAAATPAAAELSALGREAVGPEAFGREAVKDDPLYYLKEWSSEESRYLRCSYLGASGTEPFYDVTPELQKAYSFVVGLREQGQNFVPTESRFKELLNILKEVQLGAEGNAQLYLDDLYRQRSELDKKIAAAKRGEVNVLNAQQIRERFLQFQQDAIALVDDFRQVEYNLGDLDKEIMQDIINWTGPRGELLDKYFAQNNYIENTDQGRSVKAFSRLLLSSGDDEIIVKRIENLLKRPEIADLYQDERIHNIHDQWLSLRLNIERVMGASTKRIKSFLQPANLDANRFLKERIKSITQQVAAITKEEGLEGLPKTLMELEIPHAEINLPFDRPLASVSDRLEFNTESKSDGFEVKDHKLFDQVVVDPVLLYERMENFMAERNEVALAEIIAKHPLEHGVTELTYYVKLAMMDYEVCEDESKQDEFRWETYDAEGNRVARVATIKHLTFKRR